jgi:hypothetical protein
MKLRQIEVLMAHLRTWVNLQPGRNDQLAQLVGVSPELVANWLDGTSLPTLGQQAAIDKMLAMERVFRCAVPVYHENTDEIYSYSFAGSGFLVAFKTRHFLLTAKHVRDLITGATAVRIWVGGAFSLPFARESIPQSLEPEADFVILEIDRKHLSEDQLASLHPLDLNQQIALPIAPLLSDATLAMKGFPHALSQLEYDVENFEHNKITPHSYSIDGRYDGADETSLLHRVRYFKVLRPVTDHDGMSGSPWIIESCQEPQWDLALAGLHVRGNQEIGRFIPVDIVLAALARVVET